MTKKRFFKKTSLKSYHLFYIGFFALYFFAQYFFLYHINELQPFHASVHFFSNVIGSLSKRFLSEIAPYALIFFLLFYAKKLWWRIFLIVVFLAIFLINTLSIGYYFVARTNFQFYVLEGFNFNIFFSFLTPGLTLALIGLLAVTAGLILALFKIQNQEKKIWIFKKRLFIVLLVLLAFLSPSIPIRYSKHNTVMSNDTVQKKTYRIVALEDSGLTHLIKELKFQFSPPKRTFRQLNNDEKALIEENKIDLQITTSLSNPPKKIILVVAESLNQDFTSYYNDEIAGATPYLDGLLEKYPHIDNFYPSGPFTLHGLASMLCSHTNLNQTTINGEYICIPKILAKQGFETGFIRGATKYYVGENTYFKKFGFNTQFGKEDFEEKFPEFKTDRPDLYKTWGYSDNYIFDEAVERLKSSGPEDKLFLTLLTVDTHTAGGRCAYEKTDGDRENPILFSIQCLDKVFEEFMETLKKENLLNEDLVVLFTSDQLYPTYNKIPGSDFQTSFILKPGKIPFLMITEANIDLIAKQGSHVDIAGTILDMANAEIPPYYMGKSLISNPYTTPLGQDRRNGYLIVDDIFYSLSSKPNLKQFKKERQKTFLLHINKNDPDEMQALIDQKVKEVEKERIQEDAYFKWYYNKFFNLTQPSS